MTILVGAKNFISTLYQYHPYEYQKKRNGGTQGIFFLSLNFLIMNRNKKNANPFVFLKDFSKRNYLIPLPATSEL